jgi:hypothetical protein
VCARPTYTNIGVDDRSQFDLFEAMPGGVAGVRQFVDQLHAAGVKVLIPYNPWDAGTQRCGPDGATCGRNANLTAETAKNRSYCNGPATAANPGFCDARIMDSLIAEINADGFNGKFNDPYLHTIPRLSVCHRVWVACFQNSSGLEGGFLSNILIPC